MSNDMCVSATDARLNLHSAMIFDRVLSRVAGRVLDVGCGSISHYWALGYFSRASEIVSFDRDAASIANLQNTLLELDPVFLRENYGDTLEHLAIDDASHAAAALIEQMAQQYVGDFRDGFDALESFDTVLALESIECVDTFDEFQQLLKNLHRVLAVGGALHALVTPYERRIGMVDEFIDRGVEGRLNPGKDELRLAFSLSPFTEFELETVSTGIFNYGASYIIRARKLL